jgi:hypothetical protein
VGDDEVAEVSEGREFVAEDKGTHADGDGVRVDGGSVFDAHVVVN